MDIPTLNTKINKLKIKISNEEDEIIDIDEQIKLLKQKRKEKIEKVEIMQDKLNNYREQRKELKQKQPKEEPLNITSIPSDIIHNYIGKYLLNDKGRFACITDTDICYILNKKEDMYLNNFLIGTPILPFINKNNWNEYTNHKLNENKVFIKYVEYLYKAKFDISLSMRAKVHYSGNKCDKLNFCIYLYNSYDDENVGNISDLKITFFKKDIYLFGYESTERRTCTIRDNKIISIISKLEQDMIPFIKYYKSYFNGLDDGDVKTNKKIILIYLIKIISKFI